MSDGDKETGKQTMPTTDKSHPRQAHETDRSPVGDLSVQQPLESLDLSTPQKAATEGDRLVDEMEEIDERYPTAMEIWQEEDDCDLNQVFEIAGIGGESRADELAQRRIRWVREALREWIRYVVKNGMASHDKVRAVYERVEVATADADE